LGRLAETRLGLHVLKELVELRLLQEHLVVLLLKNGVLLLDEILPLLGVLLVHPVPVHLQLRRHPRYAVLHLPPKQRAREGTHILA